MDKNLAIVGCGAGTTRLHTDANTTAGGNVQSEAWVYVASGVIARISGLTLDGTGMQVHHAVQSLGDLTIENCVIENIRHSPYLGRGIVVYSGTSAVRGCTFLNIERIGVHVRGSVATPNPVAQIVDCDYTGKGAIDCLDYAFEVGAGGQAAIVRCSVRDCLGVASDSSTSAGILATDYYGAGTQVTVTACDIDNCTSGILNGYLATDNTLLNASLNDLSGNGTGLQNSSTVAGRVTAERNLWGADTDPGAYAGGASVDYTPWAVTRSVPATYATIQAAITAASDGDLIVVGAGTYPEKLTIAKHGLKLISSSGAAATIIQVPDSVAPGGIYITGDYNVVDGFSIRDFADNTAEDKIIRVDIGADYTSIQNNRIQGNLNQSGVAEQTDYGLLIYGAHTLIEGNEISGIGYHAINVVYTASAGTFISNNYIHDIGMRAIAIDRSPNNTISGNTIANLLGGTLWGSYYDPAVWCWGVMVWGGTSSGTAISGQPLIGLPNGITLSAAQDVTIQSSAIQNNSGVGIKIADSSWLADNTDNNIVRNCAIGGNGTGIQVLDGVGSGIIGANNAVVGNSIAGHVGLGISQQASTVTLNAEYNWWGDPNGPGPVGPGAGDEVSLNVDYDPWVGKPVGANAMYLEPTVPSFYVKPTETCVVDLKVASLQQAVVGLQAMLNFDSTYFKASDGDVGVVAGGGDWDQLIWGIWQTDGDLDVAVGVKLTLSGGTQADATTAIITLTPTGTEGVTTVVFRPDGALDTEQTMLTDLNYAAIYPVKVNTASIYIDGTAPVLGTIAATQDQPWGGGTGVNVKDCINTAYQGTVNITVEVSDALAGLDGEPTVELVNGAIAENATLIDENPDGTFNYTWVVGTTTANGSWEVKVTATDRAGNSVESFFDICVNKNQVAGQVELEAFVGASRGVTFVATGGSSGKTWTLTLDFHGGIADYALTDVPEGTTAISAKAAWNLRQKLGVTLESGQAAADFVDDDMLYGGDLNGSNSVNIQDYAVLRKYWLSTNPIADINGDGAANTIDYAQMKLHWFQVGDPQ